VVIEVVVDDGDSIWLRLSRVVGTSSPVFLPFDVLFCLL
jgi:hypothetical protein